MPRRTAEPATGAEIEPKKRFASNGNRLPDPICVGEILTDITKNQWKLGRSIGVGGFGEIYLASTSTYKPVGSDAQHVVKVEPHKNGPLFVEINFYLRAAKTDMIDEWKRRRRLKHVGLSPYIGSGSHVYRGEKYRFLVLQRFGQDLGKLFLQNGKMFPVKTVFYLGIQILNTLEYIHSHGYIHADIKGPNLLLGYHKGTENCVYLLDFGLACRYIDQNGVHKEYRFDQRKAHDGTLEYTSRDAHIGAHSRRGDLEILGYNMLQWLCGKLPWEDNIRDPEYVHVQKKSFMSNIPLLLRRCFPNSDPPAVLSQYLKYVSSLGFQTKPDYTFCRDLLRQGIEDSGYVDDGKLVFGARLCPRIIKNKKRGVKRRATEEPENIMELKPKKIIRSALCQPCVAHNFNRMTRNSPSSPVLRSHQQFSWEKIISGNPEKQLKKLAALNRKLAITISAKSEPVVLMQRQSNRVKQKFTPSLPEVPEAAKPQHQTADTSSFSNPTPAMLEIISRMRLKASIPAIAGGKKVKSESRCSSPVDSPYSYPITYAMEQVIKRREELRQQEACCSGTESDSLSDDRISSSDGDFVRATRSRVKSRLQPKISSKSNGLKAKLAPPVVSRIVSVSAG
ncbi:serine/threonine-protein kinase VRK1-like isoform X3 [Zootermopsis nevadensis]|nr:serine/threonine-protein kinase VRK1-like isoform X3 [Zootermopsis nevadensis]